MGRDGAHQLLELLRFHTNPYIPPPPRARAHGSLKERLLPPVSVSEELLVRVAESIVDLVAGCPQGISTGRWKLCKAQTRVVCWVLLELDVTVPRSGTSPAVVAVLYTIFVDFESFGRDCADFLVVGAELVGAVEQWMDVQCRV